MRSPTLRTLGLTLLLVSCWLGNALAISAATPALAAKTEIVRQQLEQKVTDEERSAAAESLKALRQQINQYKLLQGDSGVRAKGQSQVGAQGLVGVDYKAVPTGPASYGVGTTVPDYNTTANWAFTPPIAKFVDTLPTLDCSPTGKNTLGQCLPLAVPDKDSYPGSDFYEIWLEEWDQPMHSDMPATRVRGYVQKVPGTNGTVNVVEPNYLGPVILAHRDRPVRIKFKNNLPVGVGGDLFIPVDQSVMGAGQGPLNADGSPCDNTVEGNACAFYTQNRATVHLHGGRTPWISDGTPHQWITPAGETTPYPKGVSVANVPDMEDPGDGSMTFYYSNQQTARLMFYHDHAFGITRLNVLVGMAAGYVITDEFEQDLIDRKILPDLGIPLVIQDRTFVDATPVENPRNGNSLDPLIRHTDPLWNWGTGAVDVNGVRAPETGDLWLPHVYMPAQNPSNLDFGGVNPFGRWMYGPWFYPPTVITHPPIANPYHDPDCESSIPSVLAGCSAPGQPSLIPATPHPSMGMEAFFDSIVVNGTAFPRLEVEPKAYRFRILNAGNDRAMNLSIYRADATPSNLSQAVVAGKTVFSNTTVAAGFDSKTEVKMVDAVVTAGWPELWPVDGRVGGVPDPGTPTVNGRWSNWGPSFIQIGTDAGFLPKPAIRDPQPITYVTDPTAFWVGIVQDTALALMPAERADVIVDFSDYAGQTLIVYNDAPAAWPAGVLNYDYWTGAPDYRDAGGYGSGGTFNAVTNLYEGGHGPMPGFAPNTRTVMQIVVGSTVTDPTSAGATFNLADLEKEFTTAAPATALNPADPTTGLTSPLFERAMEPIIVAQSVYDEAYGKTFPNTAPWGGIRYKLDDNHVFNFETILGDKVSVLMEPKGIHDEMGASFDREYGRMSGNLSMELQPPKTNNANLLLYGFSDVPTEIVANSTTPNVSVDYTNPTAFADVLPANIDATQVGTLSDGTQIWNISHNGVDTHPIHFHIFDVQAISRIGWDGQVKLPLNNELGWKDTLRISPLMDTIVAVRPVSPKLPFGLPNSMRPLNPAIPIGSPMGFSNVDPVTGQAYVAPSPYAGGVVNQLHDFGWEYVWHCHILSHEEMDMMRPIILQVDTMLADSFALTSSGTEILTWTDPTKPTLVADGLGVAQYTAFGDELKNEIGYYIWRSDGGTGMYHKVGSAVANAETFTDPVPNNPATDIYVVEAYTQSGSTYSDPLGTVALQVLPRVNLVAGLTFNAPAAMALRTTIGSPLNASTQLSVEYFYGNATDGYTSIGVGTGVRYNFRWNNVQPGTYDIVAVVTALVPDPIPGNNTNAAALYAVSAVSTVIVNSTEVTISAVAKAPVNPANLFGEISLCDTTTLTVSDPNMENNSIYTWLVNGVTYTGATVDIPPLPAGTYPVVLTVTLDGSSTVVNGSFTVVSHAPSISATGGPYTLDITSTFVDVVTGTTSPAGYTQLVGAATKADQCATNDLSYAWDLGGDGIYDYFTNNRSLKYSAAYQFNGNSVATALPVTLRVIDSNGSSATSATTVTIGPVPTLNAPTALTVPATSTDGNIALSWTPATNVGVTGITYTLEESVDAAFTAPTQVATGISATSYTVAGKTDGIFYYRVTASAFAAIDSIPTVGSNPCAILITTVTGPAAGSTFNPGSTVTVDATATTPTGYTVTSVEFFDGATSIGTDNVAPYSVSYNPTVLGSSSLTATTTYASGATSTSAAVAITIAGVPAPVVSAAPSATIGLGETVTLSAAPAAVVGVTPTPTVTQVSYFDGTTPIGLSVTGTTYDFAWTPTTAGTKDVTAVVTYSNGFTATSAVFPVTVVPLTMTTTALVNGGVNAAYSQTVAAIGGVTPYAWSATGLPSGLTIDPITGVISGTVTNVLAPNVLSAIIPVSITVQDSAGTPATANVTLDLQVNQTAPAAPSALNAAATSPTQVVLTWADNANNETIVEVQRATDAAFTMGFSSVVLNGTSLTGRTINGLTPGTAYFFRVRSGNWFAMSTTYSNTATATTPYPPLAISTTSLPDGAVNAVYNQTVSAVNGTLPYAWSATGLPSGLTMDPTTGVISGTVANVVAPNALSAIIPVSITVQDSAGTPATANVTLNLTVNQTAPATPSALSATATSPTQVVLTWADNANNEVIVEIQRATDAAFTTGVSSLAINGSSLTGYTINGLTSGTTYFFRVRSGNWLAMSTTYSNTATVATPNPVLAISTTSLPAGAVNAVYNQTVSAVNGTLPYAWSATGLPSGLTMDPTTGVISGIVANVLAPNALSAIIPVSITVQDSAGTPATANVTLDLQVNQTAPAAPSTLNATATSPTQVVLTWADNANNETIVEVQRATDAFFTTGVSYLAINGSSLTGYTINGLTPGTVYFFRVRSGNWFAMSTTYSNTATATMPYPALAISTTSLPTGAVNAVYNQTVSAVNGTLPYAWSATNLPSGLTMDPTTGVISGTVANVVAPNALLATIPVSITVQDSAVTPATANVTLDLQVNQTAPAAPSTLNATATSPTQVVLTWADNANNETIVEIQRATDASFTTGLSYLTINGSSLTGYTINGLTPGTIYYFRVRSGNWFAMSTTSSNTVTVTTL